MFFDVVCSKYVTRTLQNGDPINKGSYKKKDAVR